MATAGGTCAVDRKELGLPCRVVEVEPTGNKCEEGESTLVTFVWKSLTLTLRTHRFLGGGGGGLEDGLEVNGRVFCTEWILKVGRSCILLPTNKQPGMCWVLKASEYDTFQRAENSVSGRGQ